MPAGSLKPMRPDPRVRGPVPSSSRTFSALLAGPPLPSARTTWISKSLGRHSGHMSPTWRLVGALAVAAAVFYYGTTSEVAWLFLLAYWIAALVVAAYVYARWNWSGLRAELGLGGPKPGPDSPIEALPEQLLRSGPLPAPVFEGDQADIELRLTTT